MAPTARFGKPGSVLATSDSGSQVPSRAPRVSPSEVLVYYGFFMMFVGALALHRAGYESKAHSALIAGNGVALASFLCAFAVRKHGKVKKGEAGFKLYMVGIHVSMVVPLVFGVLCAWRFVLAWTDPAKQYVLPFLGANITLSLLCLALVYGFKPQKKANASESPASGSNKSAESDRKKTR
jgi:hypothetical protein